MLLVGIRCSLAFFANAIGKSADVSERRPYPLRVHSASKQRLQNLPNGIRDEFVTGFGGVDLIRLIQVPLTTHVIEQERDESGLVLLRKFRIDRGEVPHIRFTHAGRHVHPRENDLGRRILRPDAIDDPLEIFARNGRFDSAKTIVGAEREDEDVNRLAEDPVDAAQTARGGFPAEAGVHHAIGQMGFLDLCCNARREGVGGRIVQSVAGGEAVAKKNDGMRRRTPELVSSTQETDYK